MKYATRYLRAKVQLFTWLETNQIEVKDILHELALQVKDVNNNYKTVDITTEGNSNYPGDLHIAFENIRNKDLSVVQESFNGLLKQLGYSESNNIHRKNLEPDFEAYVFRHKEFIRSPNPPDSLIKKYLPIIKNVVNNFYYPSRNRYLEAGIEVDDLISYGMIFTCNFQANFRVLSPTNCDNEKLLRVHLNQRFSALNKRLLQRVKDLCATEDSKRESSEYVNASLSDRLRYVISDCEDNERIKKARKLLNELERKE